MLIQPEVVCLEGAEVKYTVGVQCRGVYMGYIRPTGFFITSLKTKILELTSATNLNSSI